MAACEAMHKLAKQTQNRQLRIAGSQVPNGQARLCAGARWLWPFGAMANAHQATPLSQRAGIRCRSATELAVAVINDFISY